MKLMEELKLTVIRGNISEIKTLYLGSGTTKGVDADAEEDHSCDRSDCDRCYVIRNGRPEMGKITGTGCQLSGMMTAYLTANPEHPLQSRKRFCSLCRSWLNGKTLTEQVEGGATFIQLREKNLDEDKDMEAEDVRKQIGPDKIIGVSAQTVEQAKKSDAGTRFPWSGSRVPDGLKADGDRVLLDSMMPVWEEIGELYLKARGREGKPGLRKSLEQAADYLIREYNLPKTGFPGGRGSQRDDPDILCGEGRIKRESGGIWNNSGKRGFRWLLQLRAENVEAAFRRLSGVCFRILTCSEVGQGKNHPNLSGGSRKNWYKTGRNVGIEDTCHALLTARIGQASGRWRFMTGQAEKIWTPLNPEQI